MFLLLLVKKRSRTRLLAKLQPCLPNPVIYNLLLSFFSLSIFDEDQRDWSTDSGIPPVGLLTFVLLNFFLDDFDRAIVHLFPYGYGRFFNASILAIPQQSQSAAALFPVEQIDNLLRELSLAAKVTFVVRGGFPIPCVNGLFYR